MKIVDLQNIKKSFSSIHIRNNWPLVAILLMSIAELVRLISQPGNGLCYDTYSYILASERLFSGHVDFLRTPVYPIFIGICRLISPTKFPIIVVALQIIFFYFGMLLLYRIGLKLNLYRWLNYAVVFICSCYPPILIYPTLLLTECIALVGVISLIYLFINWVKEPTVSRTASITVLLVMLFLLRPGFLYLIVAVAIIGLSYLLRRQIKNSIMLFVACLTVFLVEVGYSKMVEKECGVRTVSVVTIMNDYENARELQYYEKPPLIVFDGAFPKNPDLVEYKNAMYANYLLNNLYDISRYKTYSEELSLIKQQLGIKWYVDVFKKNFIDTLSINDIKLWFLMDVIYACLIIAFGFMVQSMCKWKRATDILVFLWLVCMGNIFVNLLGSYAEWARLITPSLPAFCLLCALICNQFRLNFNK